MQTLTSVRCKLPWLLSALSIASILFTRGQPAQAQTTVAYCNTPLYAVNIYQNPTASSPEASLNIRVFWREKSLVFADLPAQRTQCFLDGFTYSGGPDIANDPNAQRWTLFVPTQADEPCLLFRDSAVVESGTVTQRQSN
ncbi:MAG: hypothetical protein VKK80_01370 [Prochlorothrix sp.]|nr:hypothetical protein [Prochlorothrix sp.]